MSTVETNSKTPVIRIADFRGAFAAFALSCFNDLVAGKFTSRETCHEIACDFASDLGNALRAGDADLAAKVSKANKDGESKFTISGKSDKVKQSPAMSIARVCQQISALKKEKLLDSHVVPVELFAENIRDYIADKEQQAAAKQYE